MREIIILGNQLQPNNQMQVSYAYWLSVPSALRVSLPTLTSLVSDATGAEVTNLMNGSVLEKDYSAILPTTMPTIQIGNYLIDRYNSEQSYLNSNASVKNYSGVYWDGASWFNLPA